MKLVLRFGRYGAGLMLLVVLTGTTGCHSGEAPLPEDFKQRVLPDRPARYDSMPGHPGSVPRYPHRPAALPSGPKQLGP